MSDKRSLPPRSCRQSLYPTSEKVSGRFHGADRLADEPPETPVSPGPPKQEVAMQAEGLAQTAQQESIGLACQLAACGGTVNLMYAPQILDNRQIHVETNQYDFSGSTGAQIGENFINKHVSQSSDLQNANFQRKAQARSLPLSELSQIGERLQPGDDLSKLGNEVSEMKEMLTERAREEAGMMSSPVGGGLCLSRVPLQLTEQAKRPFEDLDNSGKWKKHQELEQIQNTPGDVVKLSKIFDHAASKAEEWSKHETNSEHAKRKYVERHGNIVAMIGQAGIGKTTLTRMVLQHIIDGEMLPDTQFIFYIPFRDVNFVNETTLLRFALTGCCDWEHCDESDRRLLKVIKDDSKTVFIFDGLDEASVARLSKPIPYFGMYSSQKPDTFFVKIMKGDFFPKAKKLLTSRPRQLFELHSDFRPKFVLDILGLKEEAQRDLCRQICGESFEVVMKYLKSHPDIYAWCYVPVNCIITMSIIKETLNEYGSINVKSLTDIFIRALEFFVESDHVREYRDQFWKLSKLAFDSFLAAKIVFGEEDFRNADIDYNAVQAFLCTFVQGEMRGKILEGKQRSRFSHLNWHQLFVAIHLIIFLPLEQFCNFVKNRELTDLGLEVVVKFMLGLCNPIVMERLQTIIYPETSENWEPKKAILYDVICRYLKTSRPIFQSDIYCWIREADDVTLNKRVSKYVPDTIRFPEYMNLSYIVNAVYILKCAEKPLSVSFWEGTNISQDDFHYLCEQFSLLPVKIKSLDISWNEVGDVGVVSTMTCLHRVDALNLSYDGITAVGAETIATQLKECRVKKLDLSDNRIGDFGAISIFNGLHSLRELDLSQCEITPVGVAALASQPREFKIKSLKLHHNKIGNDGATSISECLSAIEEVDISYCDITAVGVNAIASQLKHCKMKRLNLCGNEVRDEGLEHLCGVLGNVEELDLSDTGITTTGVGHIAGGLASLQHQMRVLDIGFNEKIGDEGAAAILACLGKVGKLDLTCCYLSITAVVDIRRKLEQLGVTEENVVGLGIQKGPIRRLNEESRAFRLVRAFDLYHLH